jgi:HAD superfamily hydrolase (TIGR01509 family)
LTDANAAVLLDVDGTLVDSNYLHVLAWSRSFAEHRLDVPMAAIHRRVGMGSDKLMESLVGEDREELNEAHSRHFAPLRSELRLLPGARDLLFALAERGLRVVLATSAKAEDLDALQKVLDAGDAIAHITSSKDVSTAKPAPDIFEVARDAAGVPHERVIAVGDTVWDVEAAGRAGIACVCVTTGGISAAELREAGAAAVYNDCAELLSRLDESPIGALLRR